jgi:alpha-L-fucosidase
VAFQYGQGVYETRGGPFRPGLWGASTCREDKIYLFVIKWPEIGPLRLPAIDQEIVGGEARVNRNSDDIEVDMPVEQRDAAVTVIELAVSGRAYDIAPRRVTLLRDSLVFDRPTRASNVFQKEAEYSAERATDDDPSTRWATDGGLSTVELEVDLAEASIIESVAIEQPEEYQRIRSFEVDRFDGQDWYLLCRGNEVGKRWSRPVERALATRVRLRIFDAANGPTVSEFQVFGHPAAAGGLR